jgi:acyl carrier protein
VTIGRPIWNTSTYVLDAELQPVPIGVSGELYLGGVGLARGYVNRAGLTGERFIPDPFGSGDRLYRTGDLARWRSDGELEYLGRVDFQVKIRGFRIELGEIEAALLEHRGVGQAVVVARQDTPGDKRLVAYVAPKQEGGAQLEKGELLAHLARRLPGYMIPSAFVAVDGLPLTPNGKVDRKALQVPNRHLEAVEYVAPRTATEKRLAELWCDLLQIERVGAHDSFFEAGGHSLLAMRLAARIREEFQVELSLRELFEAPQIGSLADLIDTVKWLSDDVATEIKRAEQDHYEGVV